MSSTHSKKVPQFRSFYITLDDILRDTNKYEKRIAYFTGNITREREPQYVFGFTTSQRMFLVPKSLYESLGSPMQNIEVPVSEIIRKAAN